MDRGRGSQEVGDAALAQALRTELAGAHDRVVWTRDGDEVLVHLDSLFVCTKEGVLSVRLELECDQTGRGACTFEFGLGNDASLLAKVGERQGDPTLLTRWGEVIEDALWAALLQQVVAHARKLGAAPRGLIARNGSLTLVAGAPLRFDDPPANESLP
jgi:hypothetical protein